MSRLWSRCPFQKYGVSTLQRPIDTSPAPHPYAPWLFATRWQELCLCGLAVRSPSLWSFLAACRLGKRRWGSFSCIRSWWRRMWPGQKHQLRHCSILQQKTYSNGAGSKWTLIEVPTILAPQPDRRENGRESTGVIRKWARTPMVKPISVSAPLRSQFYYVRWLSLRWSYDFLSEIPVCLGKATSCIQIIRTASRVHLLQSRFIVANRCQL